MGVIITLVGVWYLLTYGQNSSDISQQINLKDRGALLGLGGCFLLAMSFPLDKVAVQASSALFMSSVVFMSIGFVTALINFFVKDGFIYDLKIVLMKHKFQLFVLALSVSIGVFLTNQALNFSLAAYASSAKRLQIFWTLLFAGIFLKEGKIKKRLLAAAIMFIGIIITTLVLGAEME